MVALSLDVLIERVIDRTFVRVNLRAIASADDSRKNGDAI